MINREWFYEDRETMANNFYQPEASLSAVERKTRRILDSRKISDQQVFESIADGFTSLLTRYYSLMGMDKDAIPTGVDLDQGEELALDDFQFGLVFLSYGRFPEEGEIARDELAFINYKNVVIYIDRSRMGKLFVTKSKAEDLDKDIDPKKYKLSSLERRNILKIIQRGVVASSFAIHPEDEEYAD